MFNLNIQDLKKRKLTKKYEVKRKELKSIFYNTELPDDIRYESMFKLHSLPKNSSFVRVRNRCIFTGRSRGVYQKFKISRLTFRELCSNGYIPGIKKSSW